jgi:NADH:ubiquinone oxidoreductase subunit H
VVAQAMPLAGALACAAIESGGVGVDDFARAQGTLPWQWHAFRGPVLLAAALVFFVSLVPEMARGSHDAPSSETPSKRSLVRAVPELVGFLHLLLVCGVGAFAFLGGARTSALAPAPDAPVASALLGAGVVVGKTLLFVLLVLGARAVIGRLDVREAKGLTLRVLVPVAAFAVGTTLFMQRADVRPLASALAATLGASFFLAMVILGASFARRVAAGTLGRDAEPGVNPWI